MTRDETHIYINDQLSIPLAELRFRFTPSSGPGGQHANRSATRVELFFDVASSPSLSETQRERVLAETKTYIDGEGVLRLASQVSRSQVQNRQEATARFQELLVQALKPRKRRRARPGPESDQEENPRQKLKPGEIERRQIRAPERHHMVVLNALGEGGGVGNFVKARVDEHSCEHDAACQMKPLAIQPGAHSTVPSVGCPAASHSCQPPKKT